MSYYLDYYTSQYTEGNFAQFVYNSHWNEELNELIEEGLTLLGAVNIWSCSNNNVKSLMSSVKRDKFSNQNLKVKLIRDLMNSHFLRNRREFSTTECRF
jgi:hypothetical protein